MGSHCERGEIPIGAYIICTIAQYCAHAALWPLAQRRICSLQGCSPAFHVEAVIKHCGCLS